MGKRHALHFLNRIPRATLVCAFSPDAAEIAWAREHLEPEDVTLYGDYGEMLGHAGLEAVVIVTVTRVHAEMSVGAVERGLHVLCEKPLSTDVEMVGFAYSPSLFWAIELLALLKLKSA